MPAPVLVGSGSGNAAALTATATITAGTGNIVFVSVGFTNFFSTTGTLSISGGGVSWSQIGAQITGNSSYNATAALFYAILTAPLSGATITATSTGGTDPGLAIAWAAYSATSFYLDPTALPAPTASSGSNGNISTTINTSGSTEFVISAYCNSNGSLPTAQVPAGSTILQSLPTLGSLGSGYLILTISPYYTSPQTSLPIGVTAIASSSALIAAAFVGAAPPSPGPNPEIPPQLTILRAQAADEDTIAGIRPLAWRNRTIPLIGPSALVLADRVMEKTNTTGTGTVICTGPVAQYQSFSAIGAGNTTWYAIISGDGVNWETGIGTITQLNPSGIARTTVLSSSNGRAQISLSGISTIFCDLPAAKVQTTPSGSGGGIPTGSVGIVQSASVGVVTGTGTLTFGSAPTPGNMLLFFASTYSTYSITPPASLITMLNAVNSNERIYVFGKTVVGGDPTAWAFTNASAQVSVVGYEVSNAGRMEIGQNNALQASNPTQAPFLSPLYPNGIVFAAHSPDAGSSPVANSGWTQDAIVAQTNHALTVAHAIAGPTFRAVSTMSWTGITQPAGLATVAISPAT